MSLLPVRLLSLFVSSLIIVRHRIGANIFCLLAKFISAIPNQLIIYCGVSRHGKGLVDAMNSFDVKIYHLKISITAMLIISMSILTVFLHMISRSNIREQLRINKMMFWILKAVNASMWFVLFQKGLMQLSRTFVLVISIWSETY